MEQGHLKGRLRALQQQTVKRNKYKLIGHSFTFFKVYVYDILYFKHSLGNDYTHTHMCTDYDTHKAKAIKYIRLKN